MRALIAAVLLLAGTIAGSAQGTSSGGGLSQLSTQAPYSLAQVGLYCHYPWRGYGGTTLCLRPRLWYCQCNYRTGVCFWKFIGGCR